MRAARLPLACLAVAALSLAALPAAPSYDPLMWLLWGRELATGTLDTADGPAFKPLPVAVCTLLAPLGTAAPVVWLVLARTGALLAVALAAQLARDLARDAAPPGSHVPLLAGGLAAGAVALTGGLLPLAAGGAVEASFVAAGLAGVLAWRAGRPGLALALGCACALLRIEAIAFLAVPAALAWRDRPALRPAIAAAAVAMPLAWLAPDALSTGEILRSAGRARVPNPGQPALAGVPFLASLGAALGAAFVPVCLGVLALRAPRDRGALALAVAGAAWVALVALMAQAGFSGEYRYALPGACALAVTGAVGVSRVTAGRRWAPVAAAALLGALALPRVADLPGERQELAEAARLAADLDRAVVLAGGPDSLLACGPPAVGQYRGPLLAYRLGVAKRRVIFRAARTGVAFESRLEHERSASPASPAPYSTVVRAGEWRVQASCARPVEG